MSDELGKKVACAGCYRTVPAFVARTWARRPDGAAVCPKCPQPAPREPAPPEQAKGEVP